MSADRFLFPEGTLWKRIQKTTLSAYESGALTTFPTESIIQFEEGVSFVIRILGNLTKKHEAGSKHENPFLPYDQRLYVADITDSHVCILNKFNVVDHHVLLITREFEDQETLLNKDDFITLWAALNEINGLAFYNGGKEAGASQKHKHLQIAPFPFSSKVAGLPVSPWLHQASSKESIACNPVLPFVHSVCCLQFGAHQTVQEKAEVTFRLYCEMMRLHGCDPAKHQAQTFPYNLLITRNWMLLVPRSQDAYQNISVNSLGFAGSLLVKNEKQLKLIQSVGLLHILKEVAIER
jgi:ATP adenylyltransferase